MKSLLVYSVLWFFFGHLVFYLNSPSVFIYLVIRFWFNGPVSLSLRIITFLRTCHKNVSHIYEWQKTFLRFYVSTMKIFRMYYQPISLLVECLQQPSLRHFISRLGWDSSSYTILFSRLIEMVIDNCQSYLWPLIVALRASW